MSGIEAVGVMDAHEGALVLPVEDRAGGAVRLGEQAPARTETAKPLGRQGWHFRRAPSDIGSDNTTRPMSGYGSGADLKRDIREIELKLDTRIAETHARIAESKAELTRWIIGAGLLQTTVIVAVLMKVAKLI